MLLVSIAISSRYGSSCGTSCGSSCDDVSSWQNLLLHQVPTVSTTFAPDVHSSPELTNGIGCQAGDDEMWHSLTSTVGNEQWVDVPLACPTVVSTIVILNRCKEGYDDRIDGALAFVVNDAGVKTQCGGPLVTSGAGSTTGGGRIRIVCPPGAGTSVKVRVEMPGAQNQPLQMAEIEAYGAPQAWSSSWGDMKATMTKMTQDMKDVPSDLAKANSNFDAQSTLIASLRSDRDSQSTLIATQSVIMNEQSTLIAELSTTLQQLKAPIRRADPQQSPEQPAIAPEVGSDDNGLTLRATSGDVSFESSECEQTNLCDLARDVAGIVAKFSSP